MNRARLERTESTDHGTFGVLRIDRKKFYTGELPWRENKSGISCLPDGIYECVWTYSPRFQRFMYVVEEPFPHRDGIRIHSANLFGDKSKGLRCEVQGCIALGTRLGFIGGQRALLASAPAVQEFEDYLSGEPFILEISSADNSR